MSVLSSRGHTHVWCLVDCEFKVVLYLVMILIYCYMLALTGNIVLELSKDKHNASLLDRQLVQFQSSVNRVESELSAQIRYLTQVKLSTLCILTQESTTTNELWCLLDQMLCQKLTHLHKNKVIISVILGSSI